jgi:DNA-binding CsgD family transcriptional regulator
MAATRELVPAVGGVRVVGEPYETMLVSFLGGQEDVAELMVRLALQTDHSLLGVYEQIRSGIGEAAGHPDVRCLRENELDESFVRLVARLRPPANTRPRWRACILSIEGRGVAASISHLMAEAGMGSIVVAGSADRCTMSGAATVALLLPSVDYLVIEGSRTRPDAVGRCLRLVEHLDFIGSRTTVIVLADPGGSVDQTHVAGIPNLVIVEHLGGLLAALGIAAGNPLTGRERDVLRHVADGATNQQIARRLGVGVSTVKTYLERIHPKLESRDRASAVATAMLREWL